MNIDMSSDCKRLLCEFIVFHTFCVSNFQMSIMVENQGPPAWDQTKWSDWNGLQTCPILSMPFFDRINQ